MNDVSYSNITKLLSSIDKFTEIYENQTWITKADTEEIKSSFKLTYFIEKALKHFVSQKSLNVFSTMLKAWCNSKQRTKVYNVNFLSFASDHLLEKFFKGENVPETMLDTGVRVYTSLYKKERLSEATKIFILTSQSKKAITEFIKAVSFDKQTLEYKILLRTWSEYLQQGKKQMIMSQIMNYLSLYKVESMLYLLVGILSVSIVLESEKEIQNMVLQGVLEKMLDRSIMSKQLWITFFKKVDKDTLSKACDNFRSFFKSLLNFIIYISSLMKSEHCGEEILWKSNELISICPEINYYDLLYILKSICNTNKDLKDHVFSRLNETKVHSELLIWDCFKTDLNNSENNIQYT